MDTLDELRHKFPPKDKPDESEEKTKYDPGEELGKIMREDAKSEYRGKYRSNTDGQSNQTNQESVSPKIFEGKIASDDMAAFILRIKHFVTLRESKEGDIFCYNASTGIYEPHGDKTIAEFTEAYLTGRGMASQATIHYVKEVIGHIQRQTYVNMNELDANMDVIVAKNGVVELSMGKFSGFNKDYKATIAIPVKYDPAATCPNIDKFISEIVAAENIALLYELPAWCLMRDSEIQRFVLLIGSGQDGKSKYIGLLKAFLGSRNCSSYTLQQLVSNTFAASGLNNKLANLIADMPSRALQDVGIIKAMTGGDTIQVERKYGHSFDLFNRAKIIGVANEPPEVKEDTRAFWRRLAIVDFPNLFEGDKRDPYILNKITTSQELSGLLNKAIELIPQLKAKADLSYTKTIDVTREAYILKSDPGKAFLDDCCEPTAWGILVKKEKVYQAFVEFCKKNDLVPFGKKKLGRVIIREKYTDDRDCWRGLLLKEDKTEGTDI